MIPLALSLILFGYVLIDTGIRGDGEGGHNPVATVVGAFRRGDSG